MCSSRLFDFYAQKSGYFSPFMKKHFERAMFRNAKKSRKILTMDGFSPQPAKIPDQKRRMAFPGFLWGDFCLILKPGNLFRIFLSQTGENANLNTDQARTGQQKRMDDFGPQRCRKQFS